MSRILRVIGCFVLGHDWYEFFDPDYDAQWCRRCNQIRIWHYLSGFRVLSAISPVSG